jgi:hypothetical protein
VAALTLVCQVQRLRHETVECLKGLAQCVSERCGGHRMRQMYMFRFKRRARNNVLCGADKSCNIELKTLLEEG